MPGKHLNDQQVRTYMDHCRTHLQQTSAAKAGISERSARRIDRDPILLSQRKRPRIYRTRVNPFEDVWEAEIVPLLRAMPSLQAITILRELQRRHPGQFPDNQLRTLQRHIRQWSGLCGPDRDVIFRQEHPPGAQGLSDFTDASELGVTRDAFGADLPSSALSLRACPLAVGICPCGRGWGELLGAR